MACGAQGSQPFAGCGEASAAGPPRGRRRIGRRRIRGASRMSGRHYCVAPGQSACAVSAGYRLWRPACPPCLNAVPGRQPRRSSATGGGAVVTRCSRARSLAAPTRCRAAGVFGSGSEGAGGRRPRCWEQPRCCPWQAPRSNDGEFSSRDVPRADDGRVKSPARGPSMLSLTHCGTSRSRNGVSRIVDVRTVGRVGDHLTARHCSAGPAKVRRPARSWLATHGRSFSADEYIPDGTARSPLAHPQAMLDPSQDLIPDKTRHVHWMPCGPSIGGL